MRQNILGVIFSWNYRAENELKLVKSQTFSALVSSGHERPEDDNMLVLVSPAASAAVNQNYIHSLTQSHKLIYIKQ